MSGSVASAYSLHACKCQMVCVCLCVHVYHFLFLQKNYVISGHKLFPVGMMKLCSLLFSNEHVEDGERRENLVHGECNPSLFFQMLETKSALKNHKTQA